MIQIIRAGDRHFSDFGWLKTYWLFSFSDYFDPMNIQFGALRVFNDDVVEPGTGFPTHPHSEMEIITIVLDGEMTHRDSMGNQAVIGSGDVQRMSAGTGLTHSEFNLASSPVHFYQIWIYPDVRGLKPSYDQKHFDSKEWKNQLFPVASGQNIPGVVTFHADATLYRAELDHGKQVIHSKIQGRRIFLYLATGVIQVDGSVIRPGDQARIDIEAPLTIEAHKDSHLILIDVPSCKGWGYDSKILSGDRSKR